MENLFQAPRRTQSGLEEKLNRARMKMQSGLSSLTNSSSSIATSNGGVSSHLAPNPPPPSPSKAAKLSSR